MTARTTTTNTALAAAHAAAWVIAPTEAADRDNARTAHAVAAAWGKTNKS